MLAIFKKELSSYFNSTLGYIVLALYLFFSGFFFWMICFNACQNNIPGVIQNMMTIVLFLVPLITMRSFAEESNQHTDQALFTAPVGLWEIICGKYLSALVWYVLCNLVYIFYALILIITLGAIIDWGMLFASILGIVLLGAALLAVNLFFSSLTRHQIIAAVLGIGAGFIVMLYNTVLGGLESSINAIAGNSSLDFGTSIVEFLNKLSISNYYDDFTRGILSPVNFVYFFSFIVLFLFLTNRVLDRKRWA